MDDCGYSLNWDVGMVRVGFGATVWSAGIQSGHLDGIGIYTRSLWKGLQTLVVDHDNIFLKPYAFGNNSSLMECGTPSALGGNFLLNAVGSSLFGKAFGCHGVSGKVDLFHATDHYIPLISGVPVVATVMDIIPFVRPEWTSGRFRRAKNFIFEKTIRSAQHIITVSEYSKRDMVDFFGLDPSLVSVTYLGVEGDYFNSLGFEQKSVILEKYALSPGFFLFVGTLQPRKNLRRVISAFKMLPAEVRRLHKLVIVGRDGWGNDDLLHELQLLERSGEALWLKYLPRQEVIALLQSAAALVFPSLYEGFGLPVLEAFACKCPVITSNTTSLPEVAGDSAWLVNPLSVDEILEAMLSVLHCSDIKDIRICTGYQRAFEFSWQSCAASTLRVYQGLV